MQPMHDLSCALSYGSLVHQRKTRHLANSMPGICQKRFNACSHWFPFSNALIIALWLMTFGCTATSVKLQKICKARCHSQAFSHALMMALYVTTLPWSLKSPMAPNKSKACCHWKLFSQAEMAALQLMMSGDRLAVIIAAMKLSACCHAPLFSSAGHGVPTTLALKMDPITLKVALKF